MSSKKKQSQYFGRLISESNDESDRAVAILLSAELDELLRRIIERKLVPHNKQIFKDVSKNDLLSSYGAIGTFAARIDLGYRLGLLDSFVAHDLHIIRKIRNMFAHEPHGLNFEQPEPKKTLNKAKIIKFKLYGKSPVIDVDLSDTRKAFFSLSFFLIGHLDSLYRKTRHFKEKKVLSGVLEAP